MPAGSVACRRVPGIQPCFYAWIAFFLLLASLPAYSQKEKEFEKVVIGDVRYILHNVAKGETLYSIARTYDCTQEEILSANRSIAGVIKKGTILKIPDHSYQKPESSRADDSKFIRHLVVSGDNYYQLKLKYGVSEEELLKYNPDLKDGLKTGKTILVPRNPSTASEPPEQKVTEPSAEQPSTKTAAKSRELNIGLYLPISAVVADSLKPTARTLSFLSFSQGVLIALDELSKTGTKTKLYVYDTEKEASSVSRLVKNPEFTSLDLVIGPVYPEVQKIMAELCAKNRIPMVSPLSADDRFTRTTPLYFQINPLKKTRVEVTTDYIFREFGKEKLIFLESGNSTPETRMIREQLLKKYPAKGGSKPQLLTYNLWTNGIEGLESMLQAEHPNVLVMADLNEVNVSIAMNRLTLLAKKYPLMLVGMQEFTRMQSIETENLHDLNLRFLTTAYIDYTLPKMNEFVDNFRNEFGTEPSLFAFQGHDIAMWFIQALQKSGPLGRAAHYDNFPGLVQSTFHFSKVTELGGYTNDLFTVVEYSNTYDTRALGTIRHAE